jgi:integrase/recombinase XerD
MLEHHLESAITKQRLRSGPVADHIDDFADWLFACGYKPEIIVRILRCLARWTDWFSATSHRRDILNALELYSTRERTKPPRPYPPGGPNKESATAARTYARFLRARGVLPSITTCPETPPPLLIEFCMWIREQRGVTEATLITYRPILKEILTSLGTSPGFYRAEALRNFVLQRGQRHGVSYAKLGATVMRSFVQFLAATGRCPAGLEYSIPAWRSWAFSSIPKYLSAADVERVIRASSGSRNGIRDNAMILLLARLGLRAGDIAGLRVTDVDWKAARILVSGKSRTQECLPLSQEVGEALLRYLERARPAVHMPELFVTIPPLRPMTHQAVGTIVRRAIHRAGVVAPSHGAHVLRHSAATTMLGDGVSLAGIGAVLRHRLPSTTAHYAKVDRQLLVTVAQPWPGVSSC